MVDTTSAPVEKTLKDKFKDLGKSTAKYLIAGTIAIIAKAVSDKYGFTIPAEAVSTLMSYLPF